MGKTETVHDPRSAGHIHSHLEDYLAGRLESEAEIEFETHLVVCDSCFSAYLLRTLDDIA